MTKLPRELLGNSKNDVRITLTRGKVAVVDAIDSGMAAWRWHARRGRRTFYASRTESITRRTVTLHREIADRMGIPRGVEIDHWDGDGLNNRRGNLREAKDGGNQRNARRRRDNTSGFKGVTFSRDHKKWKVQINVNGKRACIGYFDTAELAARAYDAAAARYYGTFARLNFGGS